jgi:hypothetical protein
MASRGSDGLLEVRGVGGRAVEGCWLRDRERLKFILTTLFILQVTGDGGLVAYLRMSSARQIMWIGWISKS